MAVIVQYVVERNGVQKMVFPTKREADAYDRMLDIAEELFVLLQQGAFGVPEEQLEQIAFHLAKHSGQVSDALKGVKARPAGDGEAVEAAPLAEPVEAVRASGEEGEAPAPRARRAKAA
jgi:uncharacterized protein